MFFGLSNTTAQKLKVKMQVRIRLPPRPEVLTQTVFIPQRRKEPLHRINASVSVTFRK